MGDRKSGTATQKKAASGTAGRSVAKKSATKPATEKAKAPAAPPSSRATRASAKSTPTKTPPESAKMPAAKATGGTPAKKTVATKKAAVKKTAASAVAEPVAQRSPEETEQIRAALSERLEELRAEYSQTVTEIADLQRDRLTDSAGDDQADTGSKTLEREQEITLANTMHERVIQVEHALERLEAGSYGMCERCGKPIPAARLAAFPSATLCVDCKQLEERR